MRISTNYIYENTRRTMQTSIKNLLNVQEVMATQKKINRLSDDPVGAGRILNVDRMITQNEQFTRNIDTAKTTAGLYDGAFDSTITLLSRAKELVLAQTNSAASTPATREAARVEIVSLASELTAIANAQYGDRFLFAGYKDGQPAFQDIAVNAAPAAANTGSAAVTYQSINSVSGVTGHAYEIRFTGAAAYDVVDTTTGTPVVTGAAYADGGAIEFGGVSLRLTGTPAAGDVFTVSTTPAGAYMGDSGIIRLEVDQDVFQQTNFTGDVIFRGASTTGGIDLFGVLERANNALRSNDQVELDKVLDDLDAGVSQITKTQSEVGSRENLLSKTKERLLDIKLNMDSTLSDLRDVDITEAITELNRQENAYQAVLGATSKILQAEPSGFPDVGGRER